MDILQAIKERHSVRIYQDRTIGEGKRAILDDVAKECSQEGNIGIRIIYDDPFGFDSKMARYGKFQNVNNYIILYGKKAHDLEERCGYYGEKLVLQAQQLGLNTCWVAMTFNKSYVKNILPPGEKLVIVIALGYGAESGVAHRSKSFEDVVYTKGDMPDWFEAGVEAALLAPTAINQQKFKIGTKNKQPVIVISGLGFYTKVDLGIVKYHFEVASGKKVM